MLDCLKTGPIVKRKRPIYAKFNEEFNTNCQWTKENISAAAKWGRCICEESTMIVLYGIVLYCIIRLALAPFQLGPLANTKNRGPAPLFYL